VGLAAQPVAALAAGRAVEKAGAEALAVVEAVARPAAAEVEVLLVSAVQASPEAQAQAPVSQAARARAAPVRPEVPVPAASSI
jgi:hypothetical protein